MKMVGFILTLYCTKTTEIGSVVLGCKAALLDVSTTPVGSRAAFASPGVRLAAPERSRTALSDAMNAFLKSRIALVDPEQRLRAPEQRLWVPEQGFWAPEQWLWI